MGRQKVFTAAALLTFAIGIGANTAIFSMVYGVLLRPLPYPTADRLVRLSESHPGGTPIMRWPAITNVTFHAWRRGSRTIEGIAAYTQPSMTLRDRGFASRVQAALVSPSMFHLLGARPEIGRLLHEQDSEPEAPRVVVLSAGLWRERFGGNRSVIGDSVMLDGQLYTIVGVTPPDFYFPDRDVRLWVPYSVADTPASSRAAVFSALALLRPGVTPEQAAAEGTAAARATGARHPSFNLLLGAGGPPVVSVRPLLDEVTARVRPALVLLFVSVGVVLLIACANVTNLLLSRGVARGREFAVRLAVGAGRGRLVRQLVTESMVLACAGGALGILAAWALMDALPALAPADFPRLADIRLDSVALAFAAAASCLAGLIAGTLPALRAGRSVLLPALRDGAGASASRRTRKIGDGLLVAEAALAVVLLVAAGLLGRSFASLLAVDPGYDAHNVLMARVHLERQPGAASNREEAFAQALLERLRALPGVVAAGASSMAPLVANTAVAQVTLRGIAAEPVTARMLSYVVTPGYADALSMRVVEGRLFEANDLSAGVRPVLVNEAFVRAHIRDGRPVSGRRFTNQFTPGVTSEIVGVVGNVLKDGLDTAPRAEIYNLPRDVYGLPESMNLAIRTSGDPLTLVAALRETVRTVDSSAAVDGVETLGQRVAASVSEPRFAMAVLVGFALTAMLLASIGLYGVLTYQVAQRRRELGVRAALGANRRALIALVLRQGLGVTVAGIVLGLAGAAWVTRLMQGLLFGVSPRDTVAFVGAPVLLLVVAAAAMLVPARRAASADPIEALRCE